jgi:hypothetical protein
MRKLQPLEIEFAIMLAAVTASLGYLIFEVILALL